MIGLSWRTVHIYAINARASQSYQSLLRGIGIYYYVFHSFGNCKYSRTNSS